MNRNINDERKLVSLVSASLTGMSTDYRIDCPTSGLVQVDLGGVNKTIFYRF